MAKVMVSLPDEVLRAVDVEADRRGTTRSGLLREWAEDALRSRSLERARRMTAIGRKTGRKTGKAGHGGDSAELLKTMRPQR